MNGIEEVIIRPDLADRRPFGPVGPSAAPIRQTAVGSSLWTGSARRQPEQDLWASAGVSNLGGGLEYPLPPLGPGYDLAKLVAGATKEGLDLHSHSANASASSTTSPAVSIRSRGCAGAPDVHSAGSRSGYRGSWNKRMDLRRLRNGPRPRRNAAKNILRCGLANSAC